MTSILIALCILTSFFTFQASAAELSDLEKLAHTEHVTIMGVYVYNDMTITVATSAPVCESEAEAARAETRIGGSIPVYVVDENNNLLFNRNVKFNIDGSAGSYVFSPTAEWEYYTTNVADGVLMGASTVTRLSDTKAQHAFTWYYYDAEFRMVATFTLDQNTGSVALTGITSTRIN